MLSAETNQNEGASQASTLQPRPPALSEEASPPQGSPPVLQPNFLTPNLSFDAPSFDPLFPSPSPLLPPDRSTDSALPTMSPGPWHQPQIPQPIASRHLFAPLNGSSASRTLSPWNTASLPPYDPLDLYPRFADDAAPRLDPIAHLRSMERIRRYVEFRGEQTRRDEEFRGEQTRREIEFFEREGLFGGIQTSYAQQEPTEPVSNVERDPFGVCLGVTYSDNRSPRPGRCGANLCSRCRRMKHGKRVIQHTALI
jgi:hypothetical protein